MRDAEADKSLHQRVTATTLKVGSYAAWWAAAQAKVKLRDTAESLAVYDTDATRPLREAHLHCYAQRKRFARQFALELTGGLGRRIVNGQVVLVAWGAAVTGGGAVHLYRRARRDMYAVRICEHNTSAAFAGCNNRVVHVYPTPRSSADQRQVTNGATLEEERAQPHEAAVGAKVVEPRRRAAKCRRVTQSRRGGADRDEVKRDKARALDDGWAAERLKAIIAFVKRAAGRDGAAAWMARNRVCVSCLVPYFNRDKNAERNILKAASAQLSGGNKAPFFSGCHVRRPPVGPPPGLDYNWSKGHGQLVGTVVSGGGSHGRGVGGGCPRC
ncbi:hypothetical protein I4F81_006525 [Pyropia yezoensis]|uniref:Uncharacterized protein n=1 Tax=Pyropia yezoensis TaxID=2788 RepID=A0ACC3C2H1_PYRYE|nr:hypothetical protein I4F81_006525 [Neopyropia yezoensis]